MLPTVGQPTPHVTEPLLVSWTWPRRRKQRGRYWFLLDFGVHAAALDALIVVQNIEIVEHRWRWVAPPIAPPIAPPMVHPGLAERRQTTPAIAEISIQNGEGLADYAHFCKSPGLDFACTMTPVTIDGRAGMEEHVTDPVPHKGGREVFFRGPRLFRLGLGHQRRRRHDITSERPDPIPALSPDTTQTYADHVFNDLASIFIPPSR